MIVWILWFTMIMPDGAYVTIRKEMPNRDECNKELELSKEKMIDLKPEGTCVPFIKEKEDCSSPT